MIEEIKIINTLDNKQSFVEKGNLMSELGIEMTPMNGSFLKMMHQGQGSSELQINNT